MKKISLLFLLMLLAATARADGFGGIYAELGSRGNPNAFGGELGLLLFSGDKYAGHVGFSFLQADHIERTVFGISAGIRLVSLNGPVTPFVGFGGFVGQHYNEEPAETDNIDNDEDGSIDEDGEVEVFIDKQVGSIYPELGLNLFNGKQSVISISGRYHITTEGRASDFWIYSVGVTINF